MLEKRQIHSIVEVNSNLPKIFDCNLKEIQEIYDCVVEMDA